MPLHLIIEDPDLKQALKEYAREIATGIGREIIQEEIQNTIPIAAAKAGFSLFSSQWSRNEFETSLKNSINQSMRLQVHESVKAVVKDETAVALRAFLEQKGGIEAFLVEICMPIINARVNEELQRIRKSLAEVGALFLAHPGKTIA